MGDPILNRRRPGSGLVAPVSPRWLNLAARCPYCGASPPLKIVDTEVHRYYGARPDLIVGEVRCASTGRDGKVCGHWYPLSARAYLDAA